MYATCLRCERPFGTNSEVAHLPVGRRLAFDTVAGRLWVVCERCGQWNLTPLASRWEALAECDRLAQAAESRGAGGTLALARTRSGLELLRVGGLPDADIANWRYGRRLKTRQLLVWWTALALAVLAILLGVRAGLDTHAPQVGVYVTVLVGTVLVWLWRRPPRLWATVVHPAGRSLLWGHQFAEIRLERGPAHERPTLVVPRMVGAPLRLQGRDAVAVLARLLPRLNGVDSVGASVAAALERVSRAERAALDDVRAIERAPAAPDPRAGARQRRKAATRASQARVALRPWEHVVVEGFIGRLDVERPEQRLALEMAVTEEMEQEALRAHAEALAERWRDEEEVGAIADELLVPEAVDDRLRDLRAAREASRPPRP